MTTFNPHQGGAARGIGAFIGSKRREKQQDLAGQLERAEKERKNIDDLIKFQKIADDPNSSPQMVDFARQGIALIGPTGGQQPGQQQISELAPLPIPRTRRGLAISRQPGGQVTGPRAPIGGARSVEGIKAVGEIQRAGIEADITTAQEITKPPKGPSLGQVSFARNKREKLNRELAESQESLVAHARVHEYDPDVGPPPAEGFRKGKKQEVIDGRDRILKEIASKQTSIDTLTREAKAIGITEEQLRFGSEFPTDSAQGLPKNLPNPAGKPEGTRAPGTDGSLYIIQSGRWVQTKPPTK